MSEFRSNDLIENPSARCACMLVVDTSSSMSGAPINELNAGLRSLLQALHDDEVASFSVELGIVSTGSGTPREELPLTTANRIEQVAPLHASGGTPLGQAVKLALSKLEQRKEQYKRLGVPYFQPWLIVISDGEPTDAWKEAAAKAHELSLNRKLVSLPVGVQGANLAVLGEFSHRGAKALQGLKFKEFFEWLSASMSRVSSSNSTAATVALPSADPWACV
jgi:uncharacterized protein YegL